MLPGAGYCGPEVGGGAGTGGGTGTVGGDGLFGWLPGTNTVEHITAAFVFESQYSNP